MTASINSAGLRTSNGHGSCANSRATRQTRVYLFLAITSADQDKHIDKKPLVPYDVKYFSMRLF
jgi:hypothetical protein